MAQVLSIINFRNAVFFPEKQMEEMVSDRPHWVPEAGGREASPDLTGLWLSIVMLCLSRFQCFLLLEECHIRTQTGHKQRQRSSPRKINSIWCMKQYLNVGVGKHNSTCAPNRHATFPLRCHAGVWWKCEYNIQKICTWCTVVLQLLNQSSRFSLGINWSVRASGWRMYTV